MAVVKREQVFRGSVLEVKLLGKETKSQMKTSQNGAATTEKEARTISVSGLPEDATERSVRIHFQNKKNGGGEIEKITILPGKKALVVFEDPECL